MIATSYRDEARADSAPPSVWGLSTAEVHTAFWRSRGVQVVRRGRPEALQRSAELFLLMEQEQLVWFDISRARRQQFAARRRTSAWGGASISAVAGRLR